MDRKSATMLVIGFCLALSGCALNSCGTACGNGCGLGLGSRLGCGNGCGSGCGFGLFRRCSDCTPPWVPTCQYMSCLDNVVSWETGKNCGLRALARYRLQSRCRISCDFSAGFVQAYIDLAEGRGPLPPSVPPSRYWSAYYRSCAGQPRVEDWYAGYQVGLEQGLHSGVSQFRRVDVRLRGGCSGTPMVSGSAAAWVGDGPAPLVMDGAPMTVEGGAPFVIGGAAPADAAGRAPLVGSGGMSVESLHPSLFDLPPPGVSPPAPAAAPLHPSPFDLPPPSIPTPPPPAIPSP